MAEAIVVSILEKLGSLITEEGKFLAGVIGNVDWLRDELRSMQSFLQAAEVEEASSMPVDQIRDVVYDSEDIIDMFDHGRTSSSACFFCTLKSRHRIGSDIRNIRSRLDEISRRGIQYKIGEGSILDRLSKNHWLDHGLLASSPLVHDGDLVGMEEDSKLLLGWVLAEFAELSVISLVGMGGVGKTTIIKRVYNHGEVKKHFGRSAWIYVSQSFRLRDLFSEMAKGLLEIPSSEADALSERQLQERLLSSLEEQRYLLVFDDVWNKRFWDVIRLVLPMNKCGSRVIITTRNNEVVPLVVDVNSFVHHLLPLSLEKSKALFCKKAFAGNDPHRCPEELKEVVDGIVRKCGGLPLAVVTVGGMMSRKENSVLEWRRVLDNIHKDFQSDEDGVRRALFLSYKDLPHSLRSCFLLCSVFPQDYEISRKRLVRLWAAEGFVSEQRGEMVEEVAEKYLMELINRNMIQVSMMGSGGRVKACRVHDVIHQLAISISYKENFSAVVSDQANETSNKSRRISCQKNHSNVSGKKGMRRIRSLLMFGMTEPFQFSTDSMLKNFKLLRVLDLEDACLEKLPKKIGELIHLRYLSIKGTRIAKLPRSLNNLSNLQTLDVSRSCLKKLSFGLKSLKKLRHLEMKQIEQSIKAPRGLAHLERLQVVTGLQANSVTVHEIGNLTQVKKLGIDRLRSEDAAHLCSSINQMPSLSSLTIFSDREPEPLDLSLMTPPSALHKLHLQGYLKRLPDWLGSIQGLTKLRLGLSRLSEDPFPVLQGLPSLIFLQFYEAYKGKVMKCGSPGFSKLKILVLTDLDELEEWEVQQGTMPCIQELWIMSCCKLKAIPSGFEFLTTLNRLRLVSMPADFIRSVSPNSGGGEDFSKVQHVPSIQILNG